MENESMINFKISKALFIFTGLFFSHLCFADASTIKFFANKELQARFPGSFALQKESISFVEKSLKKTFFDGDQLIASIQSQSKLKRSILDFEKLSRSDKLKTLRSVFKLEVLHSGLHAPKLIFDDSAKKATFFDFDPSLPNSGKVILNPSMLFARPHPYDALLFLIHETRHSYQFQLAFGKKVNTQPEFKNAFRDGFFTQKQWFTQNFRPSFCDFLTLNQEYEAFLFGNYVMETITNGLVDTSQMGTFASQYEPNIGIKINLFELSQKVGHENLLDAFNELEKEQYESRSP
tara:strand:+ start:520 stop:1395 length:876 start_codon:yes stop_codon:yes gene_type:complete